MTITELAVGAAAGYFFVFGTGFVFRPELVDRFATWERAPFDGGDYAVSVHRRQR